MTSDEPPSTIPESAFALLGHEVRLGILRAFFDAREPFDPASPSAVRDSRRLSYSELMAAVGLEDSGRFNYHLDQLLGEYVEQVDDGYAPTASAVALHRAVLANRPTEHLPDGPPIDAACPTCDAPLSARYEQEVLRIECDSCEDFWGISYGFPKNGIQVRPDEAVFDAVYDRVAFDVGLALTGQCPACAGLTTRTLPRDRLDGARVPTAELTCDTCSWLATVDVLTALQFDPTVSHLLVELGVDVAGSPGWQATEAVLGDVTGRVESESPFRAEIRVGGPDGAGSITVDADLGVRSVALETSSTRHPE